MSFQSSIAFVFALSLFVASPGPGMLGCVGQSMKHGLRAASFFIMGMILGDMVYLLFAVFGLAFVASVMGKFFYLIRLAGGIYLIYLGIRMIISRAGKEEAAVSKRGKFLGGFFITISNPKVIIFYCGFLPNFMDLSSLKPIDVLIVAVLVALVISVVMGSYALIAAKTGKMLTNRSGKALNRAAGAVLIGTGAFLALKRN